MNYNGLPLSPLTRVDNNYYLLLPLITRVDLLSTLAVNDKIKIIKKRVVAKGRGGEPA